MLVTIELEDGNLGYNNATAQGEAILGSSVSGTVDQLVGVGDPSSAYSDFTGGELADRSAFQLTEGKGPVYGMALATSTPGSLGAVTKTPPAGALGTAVQLYGAIKVSGTTSPNGDVIYPSIAPGIDLVVANGAMAGWAYAAGVATLTIVSGTTTAAQVAALALGAAAPYVGTPIALGNGTGFAGVLASTPFDNGSINVVPTQEYVRIKAAKASTASQPLAVTEAAGTDGAGNTTSDITITLGTDANGNEDPTKNTATLIAAALAGQPVVVTQVGTGAGMLAPATQQELVFGSTGAITLSGSPLDTWPLSIFIARAGGLGVGAFQVALDDVGTYGPETLIPAGGTYLIPNTGITITFTGSFAVGDLFTALATGPVSTTSDLSNGLAALAADPQSWEYLCICGAMSGALAAMVESWIASQRAAGRYFWVLGEARGQNSGESHNTWAASILADFSTFTSTYGQVSVSAGHDELVLPGLKGIVGRPLSWNMSAQISNVAYQQHPGQPLNPGGLPGIYTPPGGTGITHDERTQPGLGGSLGRFMTAQTLLGFPGRYFIGDASGLRSPGTMAAGNSDYSLLMNVRVIMATCRALLSAAGLVLARTYATKSDGTLLTSQADAIDALVTKYLKNAIVSPGYSQSVKAQVSRTEPVLTTKRLPFKISVLPWAYALWVDFDAGFTNVLTG